MVNDIKLQEGHPVDENLRPLKVGGKSTAIDTAQHGNGARINGDLEVTGDIRGNVKDIELDLATINSTDLTIDDSNDITLDADGGDIYIKDGGTTWAKLGSSDSELLLYSDGGADQDDYFRIRCTGNGASIIGTNDNSGTQANLSLVADGELILQSSGVAEINIDSASALVLDSGSGHFVAKKAGTEFSAANSAYAGMLLGYTRIQNDGTTSGQAIIRLDTSMTVMETDQGTQVKVTFIAPPSGNVEIQFQGTFATQDTYILSLSSAYSYAEVDEMHTYDYACVRNDETDTSPHILSFAETGLTAGTEYTRWIAGKVSSGTGDIFHGRNRTAGTHAPPIIVKAIALPATIVTGE